VITQSGVEGGAIYALGRMLRQTPLARIDLAPQLSIHALRDMISNRKPKDSLSNFLRKSVKLDATKRALLFELTRPMPRDTDGLIAAIKAAPLQVSGPRPIDEAISTAGGLSWDALTPELMLRDFPGVFCAGEMLDWDAPTGGYLITACLATGRWAGRAAADYLSAKALT
jgi:predicted flavoprotein YhiN